MRARQAAPRRAPASGAGGGQRGPGLAGPLLQRVHQRLVAERAAFLGEQRAGLQPVEQGQQDLAIARRQRRQQRRVGTGGGAEGVRRQAQGGQLVQIGLQVVQLVEGKGRVHGPQA